MTKKKRLRKERRREERAATATATRGIGLEGEGYYYIIGLGFPEDWEAGRGSLYYIEDKNGEKAMPVFTTRERLDAFVQANFDTPEAYMQMLEGLGVNAETHAPPLQENRYISMPLKPDGVAMAALTIEADYLVRDPRPGSRQEVIRVPKDAPAPDREEDG